MGAQQCAKEHGKKLVSHRLLDESIMGGKIKNSTFAREFLAHPALGLAFRKNGEDITDPRTGNRLPWSEIKDLDIFRPGIGIFVDPEDFDTLQKDAGIVLIPKSITLLGDDNNPFIQDGGKWIRGNPHKETMIPLAVSNEIWDTLLPKGRRWFRRDAEQGIRALVRGGFVDYVNGRGTSADILPHMVYSIAFEDDIP